MKVSSVLLGLLLFTYFEIAEVDASILRTSTPMIDRVEYLSNHKRRKNPKVMKNMKQTKLVPVSIWGGSGIRVSVEQKKITVEYACASGEIVGRLKINEHGNFRANGFHIMQRPGPTRVNDTPQRQPARFEGKISGKSMTLKVTLIENNEVVGNFELKQNVTPRLVRCL